MALLSLCEWRRRRAALKENCQYPLLADLGRAGRVTACPLFGGTPVTPGAHAGSEKCN
jgi:hypothetical protein